MATPMVNGVQHSWASIKMTMLGRTVTGFTAVNYKKSREKMDNYGGGDEVDHRAYGQKKSSADITLYKYEVDALIEAARQQGIEDLLEIGPFDVVVVFQVKGSTKTKTDIIRNCEFTEHPTDVKSGDMKVEIKCPLITSHIEFAV
jgi:3-oxoacyl-(acyl-carrier-protein) synthase